MAEILVLTQGFVFVAKEVSLGTNEVGQPDIMATNVRCIRLWGTDNGLGQLVSGPRPETKLDSMIPVMITPLASLVFRFSVSAVWEKHLEG